MTKVIFRKTKDNTIIALFPYIVFEYNDNVLSYTHIEQHFEIDYNFCIKQTKQATKNDYKQLYNELINIGYNLSIKKKTYYNKNTVIKLI